MSRRVPLRPSAVSVAVVAQRSRGEMLAIASSKLRSSWATKIGKGGSGISLFMDKAPAWLGSHSFADLTRQKVAAMCGVRYRKTGPGQTEVCPHTAAIDGCSAVRLLITGSHTRSLIGSDEAKASQRNEQAQGQRIV